MAGNLFGTTLVGGSSGCESEGCGTVFELSPGSDGKWKESVLHSFQDNGSDGLNPQSNLLLDKTGNIYGTTPSGGDTQGDNCPNSNGCGAIFELSPGSNGGWVENIIYAFQDNGEYGADPFGGVIADNKGNLYGAATYGGVGGTCQYGPPIPDGCGTLFEFTP
jgi:hypothetical protein